MTTQINFPSYNSISFTATSAADLKTYPTDGLRDGMLAFTGGQVTLEDGESGVYLWDPNSDLEDDALDVLQPEGATIGRWRRIIAGQSPESSVFARLGSDEGAALVGFARDIATPAARTSDAKLSDIADLRDWNGLDLAGSNDCTSLLVAAAREVGQGRLFVPKGTILVGNLPILHNAGLQLVGESKWKTILKLPSLTDAVLDGSVLHNASGGGSSYIRIANLRMDLNGQAVDAIDLNNISNSLVEHVSIKGGANKADASGRGVVFRSTNSSSSYTNTALNCKVENLSSGIAWDDGGNENAVFGSEAINCVVGYDAAPASGTVDTPMLYGGRAEGCDIGLKTSAVGLGVFGTRFEASSIADVEFHTGSERPIFLGCYSASSEAILKDIANTDGLVCKGGRFPYYEVESSVSRPIYLTGRRVFGGASAAVPAVHPATGYAAYFYDYVLLRSQVGMEISNAAGTNRIIALTSNSSDEVTLSGYDRASAAYKNVIVGGGAAVRPNSNNATDLGTAGQQYKNLLIAGEVRVGGNKVVGARQSAIADAAGGDEVTKINAILAVLRAHGLIAT